MGHLLGAEKNNFLIRDIDDAPMAAASMESSQFLVLRSPGGRLGSVLHVRNRLRRMRGRFDQWIQISTGPLRSTALDHDPPKFSIQSSRGAPRTDARALGDCPTSDLTQRESGSRSASEKSKQFGPDGAPFPSALRARAVGSGSVDCGGKLGWS